MAWWREADAGWLLACRCRSGAGSTGCAGLNASRGVTTGCQRRPASGCADVDRDWDDRAVYGGEHALPADVTIGIADPGLSEWRKVTCNVFSGFPTNFGSLLWGVKRTFISWFTDIGKSFTDIGKWITDIGKWFTDIGKWFTDIGKWITDIGKSSYLPISVNDLPISVNRLDLPISVNHLPISVNRFIYRYR